MTRSRILVVDDEQGMLEVCADSLATLRNVDVILERDSRRAAERLSGESWDLLITDIRMPGIGGVELLSLAREQDPDLAVLMITAFPSVETAVESMKLGAADYIVKPFLPDDFKAAVQRLIHTKQILEENRLLLRQFEKPYSFGDLIGNSSPMQALIETIQQVAPTDTDVLITGETGTGKELVARSIHQHSARHNKKFVPVDCGAIPEDLMESEFFGHERGAFTGANSRSLGLMEYADGGSFFLDEVGELSQRLQAKLLRVLQERKVRRVGGNEEIDVDVRVIAATARNLEEDVKTNRFREDLYYRINVVQIELPPLRDRFDDIPMLAEHFISQYSRQMDREGVVVAPDVLKVLTNYHWPGNVRQLQNVIKRMLTFTSNKTIEVRDIPDEIVAAIADREETGNAGFFHQRASRVTAFEKEYLANLLRHHRGNVVAAAADTELPRGTLYRLLKKHNLDAADFRK